MSKRSLIKKIYDPLYTTISRMSSDLLGSSSGVLLEQPKPSLVDKLGEIMLDKFIYPKAMRRNMLSIDISPEQMGLLGQYVKNNQLDDYYQYFQSAYWNSIANSTFLDNQERLARKAFGSPVGLLNAKEINANKFHTVQAAADVLSGIQSFKDDIDDFSGLGLNTQLESFIDFSKNRIDFASNIVDPGSLHHELAHYAISKKNPLYAPLYALADVGTVAFPSAYLTAVVAGDKIKKKIEGKFDDKIIDTIKKYGPELMLGSYLLRTVVGELPASMRSKLEVQKIYNSGNGLYNVYPIGFGMHNYYKIPFENIVNNESAAHLTYLVKPIALYGGLRGIGYIADNTLNEKKSSLKGSVVPLVEESISNTLNKIYNPVGYVKQKLNSSSLINVPLLLLGASIFPAVGIMVANSMDESRKKSIIKNTVLNPM